MSTFQHFWYPILCGLNKITSGLKMTEKAATVNPLEQFVLLAKTAKGAAATELIKQALDAPGVYVFGELLDMPNIAQLQSGPHAGTYALLQIFAFGTYTTYLENRVSQNLPDLSPVQAQKLRHLSIVSLATRSKQIPYTTLLAALDLKNLRELEDLIIEAIYADVIHGKLDQRQGLLEVDYALGRDVRPEDVSQAIRTLQQWCDACDSILTSVEHLMLQAGTAREKHLKHKADIEQEVQNIKKTLKTQVQDADEMATDLLTPTEKVKKSVKGKGIRVSTSSKFWPNK